MRASAAAFFSLFALVSTIPAQAAEPVWVPGGPYTFVQGQTYELSFVHPAIDNFLGYDLFVRYSPEVYEPLGFAAGELAPTYLTIPDPALPSGVPGSSPPLNEVLIQVSPAGVFPDEGLDVPAGVAFKLTFKILANAPLGSGAGDVSAAYFGFIGIPGGGEVELNGTAGLSPTIAAVPEPETWATMLAGLALIGSAVVRNRRRSTFNAV